MTPNYQAEQPSSSNASLLRMTYQRSTSGYRPVNLKLFLKKCESLNHGGNILKVQYTVSNLVEDFLRSVGVCVVYRLFFLRHCLNTALNVYHKANLSFRKFAYHDHYFSLSLPKTYIPPPVNTHTHVCSLFIVCKILIFSKMCRDELTNFCQVCSIFPRFLDTSIRN